MTEAGLDTVRHYLRRACAYVERAGEADLAHRPAPDTLPVGEQLAAAIGFAGRAVLPLAGRAAPDWPDPVDRASLQRYGREMQRALDALRPSDLGAREIAHRAGFADVTQTAEDYLLRFALPNMVFHLTAAHIGLKQAGHALGKADFDALHAYPPGFSFDKK